MNSLQYALELFDRGFGSGMNRATAQTRGLDGAVRQTNTNFRTVGNTGESALSKITKYAKTAAIAVTAALSVGAVVSFGQELTGLTAKFEGYKNAVDFASGAESSKNFEFLHQTIDDLSLPMESAYKGFQMLTGSLKGTALEGQATRDIFEAVGVASTVMNLSADQSEGAFLALSQMASKGKVQAEELRGQLGERIPGALNIAAKAMGVSQQEFNKMLDSGQVYANDFLPKFAKELKGTFEDGLPKAMQSMQAAINRYDNGLINFKMRLGEVFRPMLTGAMEVGSKLFGFLGEMMNHLDPVKEALKGVAVAFQPVVDAFKNNPFGGFSEDTNLAKAAMEGIASVIQFVTPLFELIGKIIGGFETALNTVRAALMDNIGMMMESGNAAQYLTNIMDTLNWVWELIAPAIGYVGDILGAVIGVVFRAIDAFMGVSNAVFEWGKKTEWIQQVLNTLVGVVQSVFKSIRDVAVNVLGGVADLLVGIFTLDVDMIKSALSKGFDAIADTVMVVPNMINEGMKGWNEELEKPITKDVKLNGELDVKNDPTNVLTGDDTEKTTEKVTGTTPASKALSGSGSGGGGDRKNIFNIQSFVKELTIQTTNLKESPQEIKRIIEQIFNEGIADLEIRANA
ncbi:MAG TPA: tape measure protein [Moheibacter sp.]|nr:tape measure protein [Moheibacter sp.]